MMFDLLGKRFDADYLIKIQLLLQAHIALWDVIEGCERQGSLDSAIKSDNPNDLVDCMKSTQP